MLFPLICVHFLPSRNFWISWEFICLHCFIHDLFCVFLTHSFALYVQILSSFTLLCAVPSVTVFFIDHYFIHKFLFCFFPHIFSWKQFLSLPTGHEQPKYVWCRCGLEWPVLFPHTRPGTWLGQWHNDTCMYKSS